MSKMKDLWLDANEPQDYEQPEFVQAGITRETMARMKAWIAKDMIQKAKDKND